MNRLILISVLIFAGCLTSSKKLLDLKLDGTRARLERATSLDSWTPISTNSAASTGMSYTEPASSMKFFRAIGIP